MRITRRYRLALLIAFAAIGAYPFILAYRFIDYSGGSMTSSGAYTALVEATKRGDLPMMRALLLFGVNPDARADKTAMPLLSIAAREGWDRPAAILLDYGADPNGVDPHISNPGDLSVVRPSAIMIFDRPMFLAASRG